MSSLKNTSFLFLLALISCSNGSDENIEPPTPDFASVDKLVTFNAGQTYQTIEGFGASDCWTPAYVGKSWTSKRDGISELLFSQEISSGQPKGIALSMWRVNMGGGSAEQGSASGIDDKSRRAESYLTSDGKMDWSKCEGQRYFMKRAKDFGCPSFVLFSNTPPVQYTYNNKGFSNRGGVSNLKSECYGDFASYMAKVAEHFVSEGYPVTDISPVNEPQFNWDGGQEGTAWTNDEVAKLARALDKELTANNLSTRMLLAEAADWEYLYKVKDDNNRSNIMSAFFNESSSAYIGNLTHMPKRICGHSYWTDGTWDKMQSTRQNLASAAALYGVEIWQTEWSMLGDGYSSSEFVGYDRATEMDIALYMSKVIHNDLTVAGVSSWSYWTSMDVSRWGHKDRFLLISLVPKGGESGDIEQEGTYTAAPTLWVLGNYSRFVRPGFKRIQTTLNESRSFFGSAYINEDKSQIVAVFSNLSSKGVRLVETHTGWSGEVKSIKTYTTTSSKSLLETTVSLSDKVVLEPESVTTVVYNLK